jgi:spore germination cell wall hydrolase CwlJ-like protein
MLEIQFTSDAEGAAKFLDLSLLALMVWREARGEPYEAKLGVAWTAVNRAKRPSWWGGPSIASVILKRSQFTSFMPGDPNALKFPLPDDPSWPDSYRAAVAAYTGAEPDPTAGATHYFSTNIVPPGWASFMTETARLGNFCFFRA